MAERAGFAVFEFEVGEGAFLVVVAGEVGAGSGEVGSVGPAGVVDGVVPAGDVVLIQVGMDEGEGGEVGEGVFEFGVEGFFGVAGVSHGAEGGVADVSDVFGGGSEEEAPFSADADGLFETGEVGLGVGVEAVVG